MKRQVSESEVVGVLLALSGGFMDAYSYINRGKVFANAETGNIVLMALNICEGNFVNAVNYLIPIISFALGVLLCDGIKYRRNRIRMIHWRQILALLEVFALIMVAFFPQSMNKAANSTISLVSGIQFATFPKVNGTAMATTMCTGNLKSGTQNLYNGIKTGDREALKKGIYYFACIFIFTAGTMLGYAAVGAMAERAILIAAAGLAAVFAVMFIEGEE